MGGAKIGIRADRMGMGGAKSFAAYRAVLKRIIAYEISWPPASLLAAKNAIVIICAHGFFLLSQHGQQIQYTFTTVLILTS
jgi:hypothetical protein